MKYKHQNRRKYIKLPLNIKTLLPLNTKSLLLPCTKSPKLYSPFLLRIAKGKLSPQRVEEVEKHSCSSKNQLSKRQPPSTTHQEAVHKQPK